MQRTLLLALLTLLVAPLAIANGGEAEAVAAIKKLGGTVKVDETREGKPVISVSLQECRFSDTDLAPLGALS